MKYLIAVFGIPACLGLGWYVYDNSLAYKQPGRKQRSEEPISVNVVSVQKRTLEDSVRLVGRLEPRAAATLRAQISGYVVSILKDVGDRVVAGRPIILLDDTKHKQAVASADAALKVARASLAVAKKEKEPAEVNLRRYRDLLKQGTATPQQVEDAQAALDVLVEKIRLQEQNVKSAEVELKNRRQMLDETKIVSKFSGYIAERMVDSGDLANPNDPLLRIVDIETVRLAVNVVEHEYGKIRIGQSAKVTVDAIPGAVFTGRVTRKAPVLNPETRTGMVQIEVPNPAGQLKPGMTARAVVVIHRRSNATVVPIAAVLSRDGKSFLYVVSGRPERAVQRDIKTGIRDGKFVEIRGGVGAKDRIITLGNRLLEAGRLVVPVKAAVDASAKKSGKTGETPHSLEAGGG